MTVIDLFSGIGGFSLGLERAGMKTIQFVEIDKFCQMVLKRHWPEVPIHEDINTYIHNGQNPDIITAGFPCQPFSRAKHGVPSKIANFSQCIINVITITHPKYAIIENINKSIIEWIASELRNIGYRTIVRCYSAEKFGAWHKRNRWFLIAHPNDKGKFQSCLDAKMAIMQSLENRIWWRINTTGRVRVADGISRRMDRSKRLKALGNSVVPQIVEIIGRAIIECEAPEMRN